MAARSGIVSQKQSGQFHLNVKPWARRIKVSRSNLGKAGSCIVDRDSTIVFLLFDAEIEISRFRLFLLKKQLENQSWKN